MIPVPYGSPRANPPGVCKTSSEHQAGNRGGTSCRGPGSLAVSIDPPQEGAPRAAPWRRDRQCYPTILMPIPGYAQARAHKYGVWTLIGRMCILCRTVYQITSVETAPLSASHAQGRGMESNFNTSVVSIASMNSMSLMAGQYKKWQKSSVLTSIFIISINSFLIHSSYLLFV